MASFPLTLPHPPLHHIFSSAPTPSLSSASPSPGLPFSSLFVFFPFPSTPHSPALAPPSPHFLPTPWHRPSLAPGAPRPPGIGPLLSGHRPSVPSPPAYRAPFGQTDDLRSICLIERKAFFDQTEPNKGLLFGPVWPNGVGRGTSTEEGGAGLMPKSGKETGPKGKRVVLKKGGDKDGVREGRR